MAYVKKTLWFLLIFVGLFTFFPTGVEAATGNWVNLSRIEFEGDTYIDTQPYDDEHYYTQNGSQQSCPAVYFQSSENFSSPNLFNEGGTRAYYRDVNSFGECGEETEIDLANADNRNIIAYRVDSETLAGIIFRSEQTDPGSLIREFRRPPQNEREDDSTYYLVENGTITRGIFFKTVPELKICRAVFCQDGQLANDGNPVSAIPGVSDTDNLGSIGSGDAGGDDTKCITEGGLDWLVCGALNFIADTMSHVEGFIDGQFVTQPLDINDGQDPIRSVWSAFRTLANIAFIIAFFVVIFAQSLSLNIDAYTVKKMLPRLAIGVILVQFSFVISGFLIDITNVLGKGVGDLIINAVPQDVRNVELNLLVGNNEPVTGILSGGAAIGAGALTLSLLSSGAIGVLAGTILPIIAIGLLFLLVVFLVIVLRDLLIVVAVILSPLAFVAWILPNTENIFKFWWSSFTKLLLMYPLIMLIFATSKVLAMLTFQVGENATGFNIIMALLILIVPLAAVPFTFKVGGTLLGAAYGTATSLASKGQQAARQTGRYAKLKDRTKQRELDLRSGMGLGRGRRFRKAGPALATSAALSRARGQHKTFEQLGPDVQSAQKRLETLHLQDSLPAAQMLIRDKEDAEQLVQKEKNKDPQRGRDYEEIFNVLSKEGAFGDVGYGLAGSQMLAKTGQVKSEDLAAVAKNFGPDSTFGSKAMSDLKLSKIEKNPHFQSLSYDAQSRQMRYSKPGEMGSKMKELSTDKLSEWSTDAWGYAIRDALDLEGTRSDEEQEVYNQKINQILSSDRISQNVKAMIKEAQESGKSVDSLMRGDGDESEAFRNRVGLSEPPAPY